MGKDDKVQLGRILLKRKMVTQDELDRALREQKEAAATTNARPLASRLIDSGAMAEIDALKALSEQHGVPGIDLRQVVITQNTLALVPREVAEGRRLIPFLIDDEKLLVAMANPSDKRMIDELEFVTALRVFPYVAMESALDRAIASAYDTILSGRATYEGPNAKRKGDHAAATDLDDMTVGTASQHVVVDDDAKHAAETARMNTDGFGDTRDEVSSVMNAPVPKNGQEIVLVVDDDDDIRKLVRRLLTEKGFRVLEAKKGDEALRAVKDANVDLIILDAMLPEVHGFDIAKQLKGSEKYGHIPIIMISAEHRGWRIAEDVKTNYGIDEYVEKPFVASAFLQTVSRVLAKSKEKASTTTARDPEDIRADAKTALDDGVRLYKEGKVPEAIETLKRGIKLDPLAYRLRYHLGLLYGKQGRVHDGVHELERAVELNPKAFMAVKNLAVLYEKAGFKNKAVEMWEKCVELSPDEDTGRQIREHLAALG